MKRHLSGSSRAASPGAEAQAGLRPGPDAVPGSFVRVDERGGRVSGPLTPSGPGTLAALVAHLERRADEAERMQAHAPVAAVLRDVLAELGAFAEPEALALVAPASPAQLLTADEVAAVLKCSRKWVYRNLRKLPFARRVGRAVRFDQTGLSRWLARLR